MRPSQRKELRVRRLGRIDYEEAFELQKALEKSLRNKEGEDTLLLLEHPHVFTLGRGASRESIFATDTALGEHQISIHETDRGGKVTYHGIGQLVGYPVINLSPDREDVHRYVRDLEEVIIRTAGDFQIDAFRIKGLTGVHTKQGKIAAIGIHISRWVTTHGFALNVNPDLRFFSMILACEGEPVTSMSEITGLELTLSDVEPVIIRHFLEVFGYDHIC
jgi:lipoyl(octanoyl) transferase